MAKLNAINLMWNFVYWILCVSSFATMQFKSHHKCNTCWHVHKLTSKGDTLRSKDATKNEEILSTNVDRVHFCYITFSQQMLIANTFPILLFAID